MLVKLTPGKIVGVVVEDNPDVVEYDVIVVELDDVVEDVVVLSTQYQTGQSVNDLTSVLQPDKSQGI